MPPQFHKLKQLKLIYPKSILKHGILALRDGYYLLTTRIACRPSFTRCGPSLGQIANVVRLRPVPDVAAPRLFETPHFCL